MIYCSLWQTYKEVQLNYPFWDCLAHIQGINWIHVSPRYTLITPYQMLTWKAGLIFKWDTSAIKYLGVWIPDKTSPKYTKWITTWLLRQIKADFARWTILPLDMSNRIETIKMNVLPWLLYLFQSLPVEVPLKDFRELNRIILRLVWNSRRHWIKYKILQLSIDEGRLCLPSMEDYYIAAQLRPLVCWCSPNYSAKWKDLEWVQSEAPAQFLWGNCHHHDPYTWIN